MTERVQGSGLVDGDGRRLLTAQELADELGRSRRWVYRATAQFGLPCVQLGRAQFYRLADVELWITEHLKDGTDKAA